MIKDVTNMDNRQQAIWLFAGEAKFIASITNMQDLSIIEDSTPKVAFIGRSNVGKSTLINGLTARKKLAFSSKTPGRTQALNFFLIGEKFFIIDMPGYGYAKASFTKAANWNALIEDYLYHKRGLKRLFLLLDSRFGIKKNDEEFMNFLDRLGVAYQIVLTKTDKVKKEQLKEVQLQVAKQIKDHPACLENMCFVNYKDKDSLLPLKEIIKDLVL